MKELLTIKEEEIVTQHSKLKRLSDCTSLIAKLEDEILDLKTTHKSESTKLRAENKQL